MSLVAQALMTSATEILKGETWADQSVYLSPVDPIAEVLRGAEEQQKPVIAVYVEKADFKVEGKQTQGVSQVIVLKAYVYVAPGRKDVSINEIELSLDTHTAPLTLAVMARQLDAALFHSESTPWVDTWRKMISSVSDRNQAFMLVEVEDGLRIPTMEIVYTLNAIPDPQFGTPMTAAWTLFDAALRSLGAEGETVADVFKALMEDPDGLPSYDLLQRNFGLTSGALIATGLAPYNADSVDPGEEPPVVEEVTGSPDVEIVPPFGD